MDSKQQVNPPPENANTVGTFINDLEHDENEPASSVVVPQVAQEQDVSSISTNTTINTTVTTDGTPLASQVTTPAIQEEDDLMSPDWLDETSDGTTGSQVDGPHFTEVSKDSCQAHATQQSSSPVSHLPQSPTGTPDAQTTNARLERFREKERLLQQDDGSAGVASTAIVKDDTSVASRQQRQQSKMAATYSQPPILQNDYASAIQRDHTSTNSNDSNSGNDRTNDDHDNGNGNGNDNDNTGSNNSISQRPETRQQITERQMEADRRLKQEIETMSSYPLKNLPSTSSANQQTQQVDDGAPSLTEKQGTRPQQSLNEHSSDLLSPESSAELKPGAFHARGRPLGARPAQGSSNYSSQSGGILQLASAQAGREENQQQPNSDAATFTNEKMNALHHHTQQQHQQQQHPRTTPSFESSFSSSQEDPRNTVGMGRFISSDSERGSVESSRFGSTTITSYDNHMDSTNSPILLEATLVTGRSSKIEVESGDENALSAAASDRRSVLSNSTRHSGHRISGMQPIEIESETALQNSQHRSTSTIGVRGSLVITADAIEDHKTRNRILFALTVLIVACLAIILGITLRKDNSDEASNRGDDRNINVDGLPFDKKIATIPETICFDRNPGFRKKKANSTAVCPKPTSASHGGGAGNLIARILLHEVPEADFCIINGGAVTADIEEGDFTVEHLIMEVWTFENRMSTFEMTGRQIVQALEQGFSGVTTWDEKTDANLTGAYPYASGLRYHVDMSAPEGNRLVSIEMNPRIADKKQNADEDVGWTELDLERRFTVVVNSFIASGRDDYSIFEEVERQYVQNLDMEVDNAIIHYALENEMLLELPLHEYSTQSYIPHSV